MDREKAITVTTGFVINLGIATTLIAIMFFLFQGVFIDVQDETAGSEMRIIGEKVSSELQRADRLAQQGNGTLELGLPQFEQAYRLNVTGEREGQVILRSRATKVAVNYSVDSDITNGGYGNQAGGRIVIEYRNVGNGEIELR
jgi:hypothetical protein